MEFLPLNVDVIRARIKPMRFGRDFYYHASLPSTNAKAKELIRAGSRLPLIVYAENQTEGKGRFQRSWFSPENKGIWVSVAFPLIREDRLNGHYNFMMSLSIAAAVETCTGLNVSFKWPNDIQISGRKVCGILSENFARPNGESIMIVGAGINVNVQKDEFAAAFRETATSLMIESGTPVDRNNLTVELILSLNVVYELWEQKGIDPIYHGWVKKCSTPGKVVTINTSRTEITGKAEYIRKDGSLVITDAEGKSRTIFAGDLEYTVDQ